MARHVAAALTGTGAVLGAALWLAQDRPVGPGQTTATNTSPPRLVDGRHLPVPGELPPPEVQILSVMETWREAIISQQAEAVLDCDRIFRDDPARYGPGLVESARTDPDPRVRAFSTRVLGKIEDVAYTPVFEALLEDDSPFVRYNAVWGLKRLGDRSAIHLLTRVERRDRDEKVRLAATKAIAALSEASVATR